MRPLTLILALLFVAIILLFIQKPIAQTLDYHNFIDSRTILGIPIFWNVMSNLPFSFIGIYGIKKSIQDWLFRPDNEIRWLPIVLCFGILTTSFGSAYYHWSPNNDTLVWDRLPMTLMFMALFTLIVYDFCGEKAGKITFWTSLSIGIFSVFYWQITEMRGEGDLRLYILVQFFPLLILPFLFIFFPKMVQYGYLILGTSIFYILAKVCEHTDVAIFNHTNHNCSGHTLKHLLAGAALLFIIKLLNNWRKKDGISLK